MNHSPYLDRPLFPLTVALPQMLEKIGVELPARPKPAAYASARS